MKSCALLILLFVAFITESTLANEDIVQTATLTVKMVEGRGFGDENNLYAWSMETFKDKLYVGTLNVRGGALGMNLFLSASPVISNGGEIHQGTRADDGTWTWVKVVQRGLTGTRLGPKLNYGFRKLITVGDYLYGVSGNHVLGFIVVRTQDGLNWSKVNEAGFGNRSNTSGRGMAVFEGYLYVGTENRKQGAEIWRRGIEDDGSFTSNGNGWDRVIVGGAAPNGIGSSNNHWFSDFLVYNEKLYTGTLNKIEGSQLWRFDGEHWEIVYEGGNGVLNDRAIMKLAEFGGQMYVGTMNFVDGASLLVSTNSGTKTDADDFEYVYKNGNGDSRNVYSWYMIKYESRFYVGTFNAYGQLEFDLYSSPDPINGGALTVETLTAFGNNNIYGIRSMTVFKGKLIIGSASNNKPAMLFEASAN